MDTTCVPAAEASAVASTKTCVAPAEAATMSAASVTSAMLRPNGYGQKKRERRDSCEATHGEIIRPIASVILSNFVSGFRIEI